jgi:hypothetical protein
MSQPRHRRHEWSAIREYRVPKREPRHAADRTRERLGAESPDVRELMEAFVPPAWIRDMGRGGVR